LAASKADTVVQAIWEAWLYVTPMPWSQEAEENAWLQPTPIPKELLAVTNAYFMLMIVTYGNTTTRYGRRLCRNRCHYSYSVHLLPFSRIP